MAFNMDYDVVFCNMILHWLEDAPNEFRRVADATKQYIVVTYRTHNENYVVENGLWFPTEEELERLAKSVGFEVKYKELLMTQDNNKQIHLVIFERYKKTDIEEGLVRKYIDLNEEWQNKLLAIQQYLYNYIPPTVNQDLDGYIMPYIGGRDLWGDKPFRPLHGKQRQVFLNNKERGSIQKLIDSILLAGEKTGWYIQDVTKRNIILRDEEAYLIDFDEIGNKPNILLELT